MPFNVYAYKLINYQYASEWVLDHNCLKLVFSIGDEKA